MKHNSKSELNKYIDNILDSIKQRNEKVEFYGFSEQELNLDDLDGEEILLDEDEYDYLDPEGEEGPYCVEELICLKCLKRHIGVYSVWTPLKEMECPYCNEVGTLICSGQEMW